MRSDAARLIKRPVTQPEQRRVAQGHAWFQHFEQIAPSRDSIAPRMPVPRNTVLVYHWIKKTIPLPGSALLDAPKHGWREKGLVVGEEDDIAHLESFKRVIAPGTEPSA